MSRLGLADGTDKKHTCFLQKDYQMKLNTYLARVNIVLGAALAGMLTALILDWWLS